ncbi:MAG: endonuclease/exonuclease/phosphatase family protein [Chloroflexi bacterium]|nr:endonuclease/exonuclease/phosphatase family protein [Chloroflexota bacterium]
MVAGVATMGAIVWMVVAPGRGGVPALAAIGLPYALPVAAVMAMAAPLASRRSALLLLTGALAITMLVVPRVTGLLPRDRAAAASDLASVTVVTYNAYVFDHDPPERLLGSLAALAPAVIGLQEVTPARGSALESDATLRRLFPYREIRADPDRSSLAILSSWPLETRPGLEGVSLIDAVVRMPDRSLAVLVVHAPLPLALGGVPFSPDRRDAALGAFRDAVDRRMDEGLPVVLMGDLNTTDREMAFETLAAGLQDVHAAVGEGLGHGWRLRFRGVVTPALLRIDHMLVSPDLVPLESRLDCEASASDHCLLRGRLGWPVAGPVSSSGPRQP